MYILSEVNLTVQSKMPIKPWYPGWGRTRIRLGPGQPLVHLY